ncbi:MAG: hypothetical protein RLZZ620_660 [Pseudomonadota bacterium]
MIHKKEHLAPKSSWQKLDEEADSFRTYSREEMEVLKRTNRSAFSSMSPWAIILLQVIMTLVMAVAWSTFANPRGLSVYTYSVFVGGFIGFFPAALFALRMGLANKQKNKSPGSLLAAVVSGEFLKIAVTIALFVGVALSYPDLQWIPLLITYVVTLKCYWLAWFWR